MNKTTSIYCLYNEFGSIFYIGKSNRPKRRIQLHKKKYGSNIQLEIIDEVPTQEWKFWEKHYISLYKSWGFILLNKNDGGGGPTLWNQELKDRNSKTLKERNHKKYYTQEIREKMSNILMGVKKPGTSEKLKGRPSVLRGRNNPNAGSKKGWARDEDSKIKIGDRMREEWKNNSNLKNRILPKENIEKRTSILQYSLDGVLLKQWDGIFLAANELKINKRGICNCCLGISKKSGGFIWKYKE